MPYQLLTSWPEVSRNAADILLLRGVSPLSLDLEWNEETEKPTILGVAGVVAGKTVAVSVPWSEGLPYLMELLKAEPSTVLIIVGHNVIGADLFVLRDEKVAELSFEQFEDTIILFYLTNMHLCKTSKKGSLDEGDGEKRGRGFMNLGTMCSVYTSLPYWKECRDSVCDGPCPQHDVFGYNGTDCVGPLQALPALKRQLALRGLDKGKTGYKRHDGKAVDFGGLYQMHKELMYVLGEMSRAGVHVDVPYVDSLRDEFEHNKRELEEMLPFNPDSPKQVTEYFKKFDISLENAQEGTVREAVEDEGLEEVEDGSEALEALDEGHRALLRLLWYKEHGNGPDRWYAPRVRNEKGSGWNGFVHPDGRIHPHLSIFTSSGRLMCSSPNLQNVAKRRVDRHKCECAHKDTEHAVIDGKRKCVICACAKFKGESVGKKIRRAIIAPPGYYIVRADLSNAENRTMLYQAGYDIPANDESGKRFDLHGWVRDIAGIVDEDPFAVISGNAREAAKSIQHAGNYLEGLQLQTPAALKKDRIKKEIAAGARIVFPNWTFRGKVVTFTGSNLAKRAFGSATYENRKKALDIAQKYFGRFEGVRGLQQRITKQVEMERVVRPPHGYVLMSYGYDEDRLKQAAAVYGSQPVAHITKLALIDAWREYAAGRKMLPVLQVHDEVLTYVPDSVPPDVAREWLVTSMELETPEMPKLIIPADPGHGPNWRDQAK